MKKINTKQVLLNIQGKELTAAGSLATVGLVLCEIMSGNVGNKQRGFQLAKKFALDDDVEVSAEDIVFIKKEVEKSHFNALVAGQILELLEQ